MCPQITCMRRCIVTLVAFVWLFSTVCFQMFPQIACMSGCIFTLVAFVRFFSTAWEDVKSHWLHLFDFVWLFSTVCFQMFPQLASMSGCIFTLVAFVRFVSTVRFQVCPQIACLRGCKVTLIAFVWLFSKCCVFSNVLLPWKESAQTTLHLHATVPTVHFWSVNAEGWAIQLTNFPVSSRNCTSLWFYACNEKRLMPL